ncbi:MAG: hypothetical protein K8J08_06400 [Thermoanaerobaculia bacterium]|nr:hypothetical protein [Thermoanaerobaculia bacterium]
MTETNPATETKLVRGVENPAIIDLISTDPRRDQVVLTLIEKRPWGLGPDQLEQLNDKLSNYFVYVLDGHLAEQYPQYAGKSVRLQLDSVHEPDELARELLRNATQAANERGLALVLRVVDEDAIPPAPWEA